MELFPHGGFVRLRSRARDKYIHADADASGVSLRPLGAAPSVNAVWKPERWPSEGDFLILQGVAYGRYLAVSDKDAPPGHRGVRAVQRDYNSPHAEAPFLWTAFRVDADQNYVRLHNHQRWLRANGRHRYWNNVVTIDTRNASLTTMMQWRVEEIPVSPEPLPLPPPPQQPTVSYFAILSPFNSSCSSSREHGLLGLDVGTCTPSKHGCFFFASIFSTTYAQSDSPVLTAIFAFILAEV
jgi:hypothetical protein